MFPITNSSCKVLVKVAAAVWTLLLPLSLNAQMQRQAQNAAQQVMKVDVKPLARGKKAGTEVPVEIRLLDANNRPIPSSKDQQIEVETVGRSGASHKQSVDFKAGESSKTVKVSANEPGLTKIKVRQKNDELLDSSSYVLIGPKDSSPQPRSNTASGKSARKGGGRRLKPISGMVGELGVSPGFYREVQTFTVEPIKTALAFMEADVKPDRSVSPQPAVSSGAGRLMMQVSDRGTSGFLADGKDAAKVAVYYLSQDGQGAPTDIQVWLRAANAELDHEPLIVRRGELAAEAYLTARAPADASVSFVSSSPNCEVEGQKESSVKFVPAIYGIALTGPSKLSLVDSEALVAQFYDQDGKTIKAGTKRTVTFINKSPNIHLKPVTVDVDSDASEARTILLPVAVGKADLEAFTPGYHPAQYNVQVTVRSVVILWLIGGALGGLCAFYSLKGSLLWRILLGIIAGAVLTWAYVWGALPSTASSIAHNLLSVLFISLVGGYLGIRVLDFIARKLGFV